MTKPFSPNTDQVHSDSVATELSDSDFASTFEQATPSELMELFQKLPNPLQKRLLQMAAPLLLVPEDVQESFVGFIKEAVRQMQTR
jgi:hypothetical protein